MSKQLNIVVALAKKAHDDFINAPEASKDYFSGKANALSKAANELRKLEVNMRGSDAERDVLKGYIDRSVIELCGAMCLDNEDERRFIIACAAAGALKYIEDLEAGIS